MRLLETLQTLFLVASCTGSLQVAGHLGGVISAGVSEFSKGLSPKSGPRNAAQLRVGQVLKAL